MHAAVELKLDEVVKPAKTLFDDWMLHSKRIPPNIRDVVYAAGIKFGNQEEWNYCWEMYKKAQIPIEKRVMLLALGATTDPWLLKIYLLNALDRNKVRTQDVESVIATVAQNSEGKFLAWRHLKAHWDTILGLVGNGSMTMGNLIHIVTSEFFTEYDYREVHLPNIEINYLHNYVILQIRFYLLSKLYNFVSDILGWAGVIGNRF